MVCDVDVSVIIPVFNQESYLPRCLESVLAQTGVSVEVVCVNDGSTDGSTTILDDMQRTDTRIVVVGQSNQGAGAARNTGIRVARGEYVIFCDADDRIPAPDAFSKLYHAAEDHDACISGGSFSIIEDGVVRDDFEDDGCFLSGYSFHDEGFVDFADYQFDYGFMRFLFNRAFLNDHGLRFPNYSRYEDPVFLARALNEAKRFYAISEVVYEYHLGHQSFSWDKKRTLDLLRGLSDNLDYSAKEKLADLHLLTLKRVEEEYGGIIPVPALDEQVVDMLVSVNSKVDWDLLRQSEEATPDEMEPRTIRPLKTVLEDYIWRAQISTSKAFRFSRWASAVPRIVFRKIGSRKESE